MGFSMNERRPTAHVASLLVVGFLSGAGLLIILGMMILLVFRERAVPWLWVVPFLAGGVMLGLWLSGMLFERAVKRETAAGYTTLRLGGRTLDEIDPVSGAVLRRAGEPRISRAVRQRRLEQVRGGELI